MDTAAPSTVAGRKFIEEELGMDLHNLPLEHSDRIYRFGGNEKRKSLGILRIPCILGGKMRV